MNRAEAAVGVGELRLAQAQGVVLIADTVTDTQFAEAVEGVAEVQAGQHAVEAVDRLRVVFPVDLEISLPGIHVGREEQLSQRLKWTIKLRLNAVGGAKLQVRAPFGAVAPHVHRRDTRAQR